jgi:hypothetical protein
VAETLEYYCNIPSTNKQNKTKQEKLIVAKHPSGES